MSERLTIRVCMFLAVIYMVIAWVFLDSIPAQVLPQSLSIETIAKAKVGDVLKREGNTETRKAADNKLTAKVYATEQWDANGKSLLTRDEDTGKITARNRYVKYVPDATTAKLKCERVVGNATVKENWIVPDATVKRLAWTIETDAPSVEWDGNRLEFYDTQGALLFVTEPPVAWDANKKPVGIEVTYWENVLSYDIIGDKYAYPITVDPTTQITAMTGNGYTVVSNAVYATARNATTAAAFGTGHIEIGQTLAGGTTYIVRRGYASFPGIAASIYAVTACTLYVDGKTDESTTDFNLNVLGARSSRSVYTVDDIKNFNGWAASGAYSGTVLNETWNTASYSASWNAIIFNAAGRDSVKAASGDSLWIALISARDYAATAPTDNENVQFESGASPYLSFTYTIPSTGLTRTTPYDKSPNYLWNNGAIIPIWKP